MILCKFKKRLWIKDLLMKLRKLCSCNYRTHQWYSVFFVSISNKPGAVVVFRHGIIFNNAPQVCPGCLLLGLSIFQWPKFVVKLVMKLLDDNSFFRLSYFVVKTCSDSNISCHWNVVKGFLHLHLTNITVWCIFEWINCNNCSFSRVF